MKKILVGLAALIVLAGCASGTSKETQTLRVFNWGEYIDETLITEFEKEFNAKVIYDRFESNEAMYTKLQDGSSYDILIPSDYMTQRMREEGLLQKVDYSKIPNYANVNPSLKGRHMDPDDEYTVPYFMGSVGIVYNKNNVDQKDLDTLGWNIFMDQKYAGKTYFYDSERDAFMVSLKANGYSMNTTNPEELEVAYNWLVEMRQTMSPIYVTDEVIDGMATGVKDLAVVYSGDASYILSENPDMAFYAPLQGTNVWSDTMVIPTNAQNPELAHEWMNFMISEDASTRISEEVGYTSPLPSVVEALTAPGAKYAEVSSYVPRDGYEKDEEFFYDANMKVILSDYWQKIKAV